MDELDRSCNIHVRNERDIEDFGQRFLKAGEYQVDIGMDGKIRLKGILEKWMLGCRLGLSYSG
jgi:hypothetical protein